MAHGAFWVDLQPHDQEEYGQQPIVDPVENRETESPTIELDAEQRSPPGFEGGADWGVRQHDR